MRSYEESKKILLDRVINRLSAIFKYILTKAWYYWMSVSSMAYSAITTDSSTQLRLSSLTISAGSFLNAWKRLFTSFWKAFCVASPANGSENTWGSLGHHQENILSQIASAA